ncbi:MAG TPA: hypothetical protein DDY98_06465 [Ruminococcaceae bacterium]|nr:hypothetical protein [Oscillospiraceae bacterium]
MKGTVIFPTISIWYGIFVLFCFASILWAYQPSSCFHVTSRIVQCWVIPFCMAQHYSTKEALPRCLKLIAFASMASSVYILWQTPVAEWFSGSFGNVTTGLNPNMLGIIYTFGALISYFFAYHLHQKNYYIISAYLVFIVILTSSRKSTISVLLGILLLTVLDATRKHLVLRIIAALAVLALVFYLIMTVPSLYAAIGRRFDSMINFILQNEGDYSITIRLTFIRVAQQIFIENFLFGVGVVNFPVKLGTIMNISTYAHNNYYELLADLGIIGFSLYYSYYVYVAVATLKRATCGSRYAKLMLTMILTILLCDIGIVSFYSAQINIFFACTSMFLSACDYQKESATIGQSSLQLGSKSKG